MKQRIKLKGRLKAYLQTALVLGGLLAIVNIGIYILDIRSGFIVSITAIKNIEPQQNFSDTFSGSCGIIVSVIAY